jgi:hypothetical protein
VQISAKSPRTRAANQSVASPNLKNIRNFVCATSLLLAVWLGLTFVSEVPSHRYPTLGKDSVTVLEANGGKFSAAAVETSKKGLAAVPVAR